MSRYTAWQIWSQASTAWTNVVSPHDEENIMQWQATNDFHEKQGRSTGRLVLGEGKFIIYLKRHWKLPWWQGLLARWWPHHPWSPGAQEWQRLQWAKSQGFNVPEPLAMGQIVGPGYKLQSYLAIRELTGMLALHEAIPMAYAQMPAAQFEVWKHKLLERMANIARKLHGLNHYHKDLYLCHYYVNRPSVQQTDPGELALIDLHRLGEHRWFGLRWQIKDLAQLFFSMWGVAGLEGADRLTFFQHYRQKQNLSRSDQWLFLAAMRKAERYAHHNGVSTELVPDTNSRNQAA
jgi:heptose I phosphotransferase